ncbi:MAG: hypothetical protein KGK30_08940, partial [Elusimicrobia bacterium]|nr:hypothetical protein [Elusimicrobiota bacterium]
YGAAGAEYTMILGQNAKASVRAGFNTLTIDSLGLQSAPSFGLGLALGSFSFDYSFVPMGVLGSDTNRFSLSFNLPSKASRRYEER